MRTFKIPTGCPPQIAKLVKAHSGNLASAARAAGIDPSYLRRIANGAENFSEKSKAAVARALDNKGAATIPDGRNSKPFKNAPPLLTKLIAKYNGNRTATARALGFKSPTWVTQMGNRDREFDEVAQNMVRAALDGQEAPVRAQPNVAGKIAIFVVPNDHFETFYDIGLRLGAEWLWKRKAGAYWLAVLAQAKMRSKEMAGLVAMAKAQSVEVYELEG